MRPIAVVAVGLASCAVALVPSGAQSRGASSRGPRATQTVCPRKSDRVAYRDDPAVKRRLVPGKPGRLVLCRYGGLNARVPLGLLRVRRIESAGRSDRLAKRFDRLHAFSGGSSACPADFSRDIVARFGYRDAADDYVTVDVTGCRSATNGPLVRSAISRTGERLIRTLQRLTRQ